MIEIHKYQLTQYALRGEPQVVSMRVGAKLLSIEVQGLIPVLYVAENPTMMTWDRKFRLLLTGDTVTDDLVYIKTLTLGPSLGDKSLVVHVYECER